MTDATKPRNTTAIPRRPYKDGVELSVVGFGGVILLGMDQPDADRAVAHAVDDGINYFDVAPSYGDGEAEEKLGPALEPHRDRVFLACKTHARDAKTAGEHIDRSLRRLRTDHFDLYQFHGLPDLDQARRVLAPGGAAEAVLAAQRQGKIRYVGFSAHDEQAAMHMMDNLPLDSILFPFNVVCWEQGGFGPAVYSRAREKGLARLALKAMARTDWPDKKNHPEWPKCWYQPEDDPRYASLSLRWTLCLDVTAAVAPGDLRLFDLAVRTARDLAPLTTLEREELTARARGFEPIFKR